MKSHTIREGACYGNYDENDNACTKICYVSGSCQAKSESKPNRKIKSAVLSLAEAHALFIKALNNILPRMNFIEYHEVKGCQHEFLETGCNAVVCRIKTNMINYKMKVYIRGENGVIFDTINTKEDVESAIEKIKLLL